MSISYLRKSTLSTGVAPLSDLAVTSTTGSPTTGTYTSGGINYKYYSFTGSGSITFNQTGLIDVLCIAGGGGGGQSQSSGGNYSGGGGAGGYINTISTETSGGNLTQRSLQVSAGANTVVVGAGGGINAAGNVSFFSTITAIGGGGPAHLTSTWNAATTGGSGGGGAEGQTSGAAGFANQGFAGGNSGTDSGGGGGGAGGAGTNGTSNTGGAGGAGLSSSITGSAVTRGGGGGGSGLSTGGTATGGGGNGAAGGGSATAGSANTGGGGGSSNTGTTGGSGIVIIRVRA